MTKLKEHQKHKKQKNKNKKRIEENKIFNT